MRFIDGEVVHRLRDGDEDHRFDGAGCVIQREDLIVLFKRFSSDPTL